ncbi:DNA-binding transcriptional LysR family regulator [Oharaeibacter diazotrophicus]|uniref:DNA-binding transcriptional LysR family regulator n=2 Tax=Oharaeibacter diazotrophicus TaxID=1920512 RepID=A0A4R6RMJ9_9HYPH|nr:DNA-binding transcriptional LysR family regulator [Oharaeibacter diazotrophicus]GLS77548.1 transcriptional regulator [Oharaeibacter diazotrophicus]
MERMNDRLATLQLFVTVARAGSFSAAAREVGLSQPSVSRAVAALEAAVGTALFARTTRSLGLTDAGRIYLERVERILADLDEAGHLARGTGELRGTLKVALPATFGTREIVPLLPAFLAGHDGLTVDLALSDTRADLAAEGVDVALRLGPLGDSTLIARRIAAAERIVVAAPAHLRRAGVPATPAALADHPLIAGPGAGQAPVWTFVRGAESVAVRWSGRIRVDANDAATAAAVAGLGVAVMSAWGCRREIEDGRLVRVLSDWTLGEVPLSALFPAGRATAAARAFVDFLVARFAGTTRRDAVTR